MIGASSLVQVGSVIGGRYRLLRQVGEGAMAAIWEAEHMTLGRSVAVKFLHTVGPPQSDASQRFVREARVAAAIKHRNVVDIIDFGLTDGDHRPFMVMELLEGQTLNDYLATRGRLSVPDAARLVSDVLRGLAAVHDAGIVHRDLKPDNIFLVRDEDGPFPKLLDFGLSRRVGRGDMTAEGIILGTPDYMSPEQAQGQRHIDARTDIYSMGVIFYELVTGQMPFDGSSLAELLSRVVDGKYVPLTDRFPDAPPLLVDILERAMHKDRARRYGNAREMRAALATANLAPFQHGESGLMAVEGRATPSSPDARGQTGPNPPSGVFREANRPERATIDAPIDALLEDNEPLAGEATRMDDLSNEVTRALDAPPTFDDQTAEPRAPLKADKPRAHTPVAYAPTMPAGMAVVLPESRPLTSERGEPTGRRQDEGAGVFRTSRATSPPPKGGTGWWAILLVIALASVAGGVIVYWMQGGLLPFGILPPGGDPLAAGLGDVGPGLEDAGLEDAGLEDAGLEDAGLADAGLADAGLEDAGLADAALEDAGLEDAALGDTDGSVPEDAGMAEDGGSIDDPPAGARTRGRPRRRPRPRRR